MIATRCIYAFRFIHICIHTYTHTYIRNSNPIGDLGARYFAGAMPHCGCLADLDLSHTGVGDEGAELLAQVCMYVSVDICMYVGVCVCVCVCVCIYIYMHTYI